MKRLRLCFILASAIFISACTDKGSETQNENLNGSIEKAECKAMKAEQKKAAAQKKLQLRKAAKPISDKRYFAE